MNSFFQKTFGPVAATLCMGAALVLGACGPGGGGSDVVADRPNAMMRADTFVPRTDTGTTVAMCRAPGMMCGTACVNTQTNAANCGRCGMACARGQVCRAGVCAATTVVARDAGADAGTGCPMGATSCGRACVNTMTDASNCGACGTRCMAGQACRAGACVAANPPAMCGDGETTCGGRCANTAFDDGNCGACGRQCTGPSTCLGGDCWCFGEVCGDACIDVNNNNANCGACGNACMANEACQDGACVQVSCATSNAACMNGNDCCGSMQCEGGRCACMSAGNPCVDSFDCCGPGICGDGTCDGDSYLSAGDACTNSFQCRGALFCIDGRCN